MTQPKPKVIRVRFDKQVPAPRTNLRIREERDQLDLKDVGDEGFKTGPLGVTYGYGSKRFLIPWTRVRWCELEEPKRKSPKKKPEEPASESKAAPEGEAKAS